MSRSFRSRILSAFTWLFRKCTHRCSICYPEDITLKGAQIGTQNGIEMEPEFLKEFRFMWRMLDFFSNMVGLFVHRETKMSLRFLYTVGQMISYFFCLAYTLSLAWPDVHQILEASSICGIVIPGGLKMITVLRRRRGIYSAVLGIEKILMDNVGGTRVDMLNRELKWIRKLVAMSAATFICLLGIFMIYPMYMYFSEGALVPIVKVEYPFVDQTTTTGYIVGFAYIVIGSTLGTAGAASFDSGVASIILCYGLLVKLLKEDLKDYHRMWLNKAEYSDHDRRHFLRTICVRYNDADCYIKFTNNLISGNVCGSICAMYLSLIFAVFAVINSNWISGYAFATFCFVQMYILCVLGSYVKTQNEELHRAFYFTPWYEYPVSVQKTFKILLHASSFNATEIWIGPFAPLNVQTGARMTYNIYSYNTTISGMNSK